MITLQNLVEFVRKFVPQFDHGDLLWCFYLHFKRRWRRLCVKEYRGTYYLWGDEFDSLEWNLTTPEPEGRGPYDVSPEILSRYLTALQEVYTEVKNDPVAYHIRLNTTLPASLRRGLIARWFVHVLLPDWMRFDQELNAEEIAQCIDLCKTYRSASLPAMTARMFFEYCRIAYLANPKTFADKLDPTLSGKELYTRLADGRDGGLTSIELDSADVFQAWYTSGRAQGAHPWEVYRGGNATHIDLAVVPDGTGWKIMVDAFSSTRLAETCRIALALSAAGLGFELAHKESYLSRLLGSDWVGVLPDYDDLSYGRHLFPREFQVADCIHFSWFRDANGKFVRPQREIRSLVSWLPIAPLWLSR
jgi:hypothetical protein